MARVSAWQQSNRTLSRQEFTTRMQRERLLLVRQESHGGFSQGLREVSQGSTSNGKQKDPAAIDSEYDKLLK